MCFVFGCSGSPNLILHMQLLVLVRKLPATKNSFHSVLSTITPFSESRKMQMANW